MIQFPNTVLPGPLYGILDIHGNILGYVTANTAHEALREATEKLGSRARVAIIKSQLDKEKVEYASRSTHSTPASSPSPSPSSSAPLSTSFGTRPRGTRGAWKPGTGKHGA